MKNRFKIGVELRAIARLLTIKGDNPFKAQAYLRAASALENFDGDLDALIKEQRLKEIPGVGNALAATIEEIYRTGECWMLQQLREGMPPGVVELSEVPGLSLKKIVALSEALGTENIVRAQVGVRARPGEQGERLWTQVPGEAARRYREDWN